MMSPRAKASAATKSRDVSPIEQPTLWMLSSWGEAEGSRSASPSGSHATELLDFRPGDDRRGVSDACSLGASSPSSLRTSRLSCAVFAWRLPTSRDLLKPDWAGSLREQSGRACRESVRV